VLDIRADEHHGPGLDRSILRANPDPGPARDHVVDLVLGMWSLRVGPARGEDIQAYGQVVGPDELEVEAAGFGPIPEQLGELEGLHGSGA
jgi:hypothetical protein